MKIVTKSKLPKWIMFILPFRDEEYILKGIIIPFELFSLIGIWISLYEFCRPSLDSLEYLMALFFLGVFVVSVRWLLLQTDILHALRVRLDQHYKITKDEDEKLRTKKRLSDLCVKV